MKGFISVLSLLLIIFGLALLMLVIVYFKANYQIVRQPQLIPQRLPVILSPTAISYPSATIEPSMTATPTAYVTLKPVPVIGK